MGKVFKITIKEDLKALKNLHRKEKDSRKKSRIMSLILTLEGKFSTMEELAKFIGINSKTLYKWTDRYKEGGLSALLKISGGGKRKESVPVSIHKDIEKKLQDSTAPLQSYTDAVQWVKQEFGYTIKYHTLRAFMKRNFGTKLKTPRKSHYKKNEVAFDVFKKNL